MHVLQLHPPAKGSSSCLCQLLHLPLLPGKLDHCRALQAGRITQGSLPVFVPSCSAALFFWMGLSSPQELQHLPRGGKRRPQKAVAAQGCRCPSLSAGAVAELEELPLLSRGQEGVNLEPRNASVTSSYSPGLAPGSLQEDPEPGKLSRKVELAWVAPAWPGGAGGSVSPCLCPPQGWGLCSHCSTHRAAQPPQLGHWECATNSFKKNTE